MLGACEGLLGFDDHDLAPPDAALDSSLGGSGGQAGQAGDDAGTDAADLDAGDASDGPLPPRVEDGLVALYTFEEGSGTAVNDVSQYQNPLNLKIQATATSNWVSGGLFVSGTLVSSSGGGWKIASACKSAQELTLETWIAPSSLTATGPARILTMSLDTSDRNFTLGQQGDIYVVRLRTSQVGGNGDYLYSLPDAVKEDLMHVAFTRTKGGAASLYLDAKLNANDLDMGGTFGNWEGSYKLAVGNELTNTRPWNGTLYLAAVYCRALTKDEVIQNYWAGPNAEPPMPPPPPPPDAGDDADPEDADTD
jgi:hypothetical protein